MDVSEPDLEAFRKTASDAALRLVFNIIYYYFFLFAMSSYPNRWICFVSSNYATSNFIGQSQNW